MACMWVSGQPQTLNQHSHQATSLLRICTCWNSMHCIKAMVYSNSLPFGTSTQAIHWDWVHQALLIAVHSPERAKQGAGENNNLLQRCWPPATLLVCWQ